MNLKEEEIRYLILLLESQIKKIESLDFSGYIIDNENAGAIKIPKQIIEKLKHYQSTYSKMNEIKAKRIREKTQRNKTFVN